MWHSRMFWRLFGAFGLLVILAIGVLGAAVVSRVEQNYLDQLQVNLQCRARLVAEIVRDWPADHEADLQKRILVVGHDTGTRITLINDVGRVLADSREDPSQMENHADRPEIRAARENEFDTTTRYSR